VCLLTGVASLESPHQFCGRSCCLLLPGPRPLVGQGSIFVRCLFICLCVCLCVCVFMCVCVFFFCDWCCWPRETPSFLWKICCLLHYNAKPTTSGKTRFSIVCVCMCLLTGVTGRASPHHFRRRQCCFLFPRPVVRRVLFVYVIVLLLVSLASRAPIIFADNLLSSFCSNAKPKPTTSSSNINQMCFWA